VSTVFAPLPFARLAQLKTRPDTVIADDVPCSVWPTTTRVTGSGLSYDHEGELPVSYYDQVRGPNVVLVLDDEEYIVVDAQENVYLPHVAVLLRRARPSGA
jgi:hypothetical protein